MAKAVKKKDAKTASNTFHNIMKASMSVNNKQEDKSNGAKEWFYFDSPNSGRKFIIRYFYENGDQQRRCTVSRESNQVEVIVADYSYKAEKQGVDIDENAKMKAIDYDNMNP